MSEYCEQKLFNLIMTEALLPCWLKPLTRYSVPLLNAFCSRLITRLWHLHKEAPTPFRVSKTCASMAFHACLREQSTDTNHHAECGQALQCEHKWRTLGKLVRPASTVQEPRSKRRRGIGSEADLEAQLLADRLGCSEFGACVEDATQSHGHF